LKYKLFFATAINNIHEFIAGLAGAIVRRGGDAIQDDSDAFIRQNGRLDVGQAVMADGHKLAAKYIIHVCCDCCCFVR
jgi:O-acetyl-ADP-ribose deacetylase (regulator of RNase III)